jgi:hypothetical protein
VPVKLKVKPKKLNFGRVTVNTASHPKIVTITNQDKKHKIPVTVEMVAASAGFSQSNACTTLAPGASCKIVVTFKPGVSGKQQGTLSITDNATKSPQVVKLKGNA